MQAIPQATYLALDGFVQIAVILLLFIAGLEVELHLVFSQGKSALSISMLGLIVPFALGFVVPYFMPEFFGLAEGNKPICTLYGDSHVHHRSASSGENPDGYEPIQIKDGDAHCRFCHGQ